MDTLDRFELSIESLMAENQRFEYDINDDFFDAVEAGDIHKGSLKITIATQKMAQNVDLHIVIDGTVGIPCDRCLDEMEQPVHVDTHTTVTIGDDIDSDDITVSPDARTVNIAWNVYEYIALAVPTVHTHTEGGCNAEMMAKIREHTIDENTERTKTDPRWDVLKNISNNN